MIYEETQLEMLACVSDENDYRTDPLFYSNMSFWSKCKSYTADTDARIRKIIGLFDK